MLRPLAMSLGRFACLTRRRLSLSLLLAGHFCTATLGCTVYSDLEGIARPGGPLTDGSTPPPDGMQSDRDTPPSDTAVRDTGMTVDAPVLDAANDAPTDTVTPPIDAMTHDSSSDTVVGVDVATDVATRDAAPDAAIDSLVDIAVPPPPEAGLDVTGRDVVDAGTRVDADATAPPPDADGGTGTVDARDAGPTCWGGTPSTHDEDHDGIVDECDNCPSISNANQADVREVNAGGTADGVGDACDPRPTAGGDSIYLFDGLNFTSLPAEWNNTGVGNWTASGTSVAPSGTDTGQELSRSFPTNLGNYLAETAFTFTALTMNGSSSVPFRMDSAGNGWRCVVGTPNGLTGQFFISKVTAGTSETQPPQITAIDVPQVGDRYRVLGGAYSDSLYCMLGSGERQNRSDTSTTGQAGFRSTATSAVFEYLLVYRLGGTIP